MTFWVEVSSYKMYTSHFIQNSELGLGKMGEQFVRLDEMGRGYKLMPHCRVAKYTVKNYGDGNWLGTKMMKQEGMSTHKGNTDPPLPDIN